MKVAVLYDSAADYNSGVHDAFVAAAADDGLEVVADEAYTTDSNTDYSVQLAKIKKSGAELLFLPNYYSDNALILQQASEAGLDIKFFGVDGMDGILNVENFDKSLAEGVMLLTPFSATATDEKSQNFVKAYGDAHNGEIPNQFAADTYDVLYAMQLAADDAKITPDMENADISAAMSASMANIELDGLTGKAKWTEEPSPFSLINKQLKEVRYEFYILFKRRHQSWQYLCDHRTWIYHGLWYCQDAELRTRRCYHGGSLYHPYLYHKRRHVTDPCCDPFRCDLYTAWCCH